MAQPHEGSINRALASINERIIQEGSKDAAQEWGDDWNLFILSVDLAHDGLLTEDY